MTMKCAVGRAGTAYHSRDVGLRALDRPAVGNDRRGGCRQKSATPQLGSSLAAFKSRAWPGSR